VQRSFAMNRRVWPRLLLLAAVALLLFPQTARGHADPIRSEPAQGGVVFLPPGGEGVAGTFTLRTWFTERVEPRFSVFEVYDPAGERVDVAGSAALEGQGLVVAVQVAPKRIGEHRTNFRILSAVDGHINNREFAFFVAEALPGAGSTLDGLPSELVVRAPKALGAVSISVTLLRDGTQVFSGSGAFSAGEGGDVAAIPLPEGGPGKYDVRWELMTTAGPKFGTYSFTVAGS